MDRLLTVISSSHHNPERAHHRMRLFLAIAWITALIISAPQFAIWRDYLAFEHLRWSQCMQIWEILRAESYSRNASANSAQWQEMVREENIYMIVHMLLIFWIPALIIMLCYVIVSCWVYFNSRPSLLAAAQCAAAETAQAQAAAAHRGYAHQIASYQPLVTSTTGTMPRRTPGKCATTTVVANGVHYQTELRPDMTALVTSATIFDAAGSPGGVHFAKNPKIVIDDIDVTMPLMPIGRTIGNYARNIIRHQSALRDNNKMIKHSMLPNATVVSAPVRNGEVATPFNAANGVNGNAVKVTESEVAGRGSKSSMMSAVRNSQSSSYSARQNRSRAIRVSFSLVAAYIICWFPYNALSVIQFIDPELFNKHAKKVYCLHGMIVFNSVINPYLYGLFGRLCQPKTT